MLLHAGAGAAVREEDIIGIFDLDGRVTTAATAEFLRRAEQSGMLTLAGEDLPKCFLLVSRKKTHASRVILSHLSVAALAGRTEDGAPHKGEENEPILK